MWTKNIFFKLYIYFILLIISVKTDNTLDKSNNTLFEDLQAYNMSDPNDKFFNDICTPYSSINGTDVSLEYRRSYYYYPNGIRQIITDKNILNKIFPEPRRNSIFLCFDDIFIVDSLFLIVIVYLLFPIFFILSVILAIIVCGNYKYASEKTREEYFIYMKRREMKKNILKKREIIKNYIKNIASTNSMNNNNNNTNISNNNINEITKDPFTSFKEEENPNDSFDDKNQEDILEKENKKHIDDTLINQTKEIKKENEKEEENISRDGNEQDEGGEGDGEEENKSNNDELNTTGDFQQTFESMIPDEKKDKDKEELIQSTLIKRNMNPDEAITFGGLKVNYISNINDNNNNQVESLEKIKETDSQKEEKTEYLYNKINNKTQIKKNKVDNNNKIKNSNNNNINNKTTQTQTQTQSQLLDDKLTNEELLYSGYSVSIISDKRSFFQIYYDILCHCQIIFYFMPNYYIYEDKKLTMIYYSFKFILYFIINMFFFDSISVINKIYDDKFFFSDYFIICVSSTVIVNIIGQFLFFLTNSKRTYIRYVNKLNNSLFKKKKRILKYVLKDTIDLINNTLFVKVVVLFMLNIVLFFLTIYFFVCFCIAYYNTQFYIIKCVLINIIISQTCPFFLVIIPAKIRKKALVKKNEKLFEISKMIDSYFLP